VINIYGSANKDKENIGFKGHNPEKNSDKIGREIYEVNKLGT